jgi:serine protease Do
MQGYEVEYGFLGIGLEPATFQELQSLPRELQQKSAAMAKEVYPETPAALGGLTSKDIILAVNNNPVYDSYDVMREIGVVAAGERVKLRVWRKQYRQPIEIDVTLGKWPVRDEEGIIAPNRRFPVWRGLVVDFPTGRKRFIEAELRYHRAVVISSIVPGSPAAKAQLQEGEFITHVNDTPVPIPKEFHKATESLKSDEDVTLRLLDGRRVVVRK